MGDGQTRSRPSRLARLVASALDLVIVALALWMLARMLAQAGVYFPLEIIAAAVFLAGLPLFRRFVGPSPGQWLCGLHPLAARSALVILLLLAGGHGLRLALIYRDAMSIRPPHIDLGGLSTTPVEASAVGPFFDAQFAQWLDEHGDYPIVYAVRVARAHDVTIFGEMHNQRENLEFLRAALPRLYHDAGVRCLAMECCRSDMNAQLERLVTAERFDRDLQMRIARNASWPCWGFAEYWDVLETVWEINRSRPPGEAPLRVVGIFPSLDLPSLAIAKGGPPWERLRWLRILRDPVSLVYHDELYARAVERETLARGQRGIVWVGDAHASLCHREPILMNGAPAGEKMRMGYLLHARYGQRIGQITMHYSYDNPRIAPLIESAFTKSSRGEVGFDVAASPLGGLRDSEMPAFRHQPEANMAQLSEGYIVLKPSAAMNRCRWMPGYVTRAMFTWNRPFFDLLLERRAKSAADVNRIAADEALEF